MASCSELDSGRFRLTIEVTSWWIEGQVDVPQAVRHVPSRRWNAWEEIRFHPGSRYGLARVMPTDFQAFRFLIGAEETLPCQFVTARNASKPIPWMELSLGIFLVPTSPHSPAKPCYF
jgi:hypothetical protein